MSQIHLLPVFIAFFLLCFQPNTQCIGLSLHSSLKPTKIKDAVTVHKWKASFAKVFADVGQSSTVLLATGRSTDTTPPTLLPDLSVPEPPRIAYFAIWASFFLFAFLFAPGGDYYSLLNPNFAGITSETIAATDNALLQALISTPFNGQTNALYVTIFNCLGVLPAIYAGLLLPGSSLQSKWLPTPVFSLLSFALGFGAVGPYLALRKVRKDSNEMQSEETKPGKVSKLVEGRGIWFPAVAFAIYLFYFLFTQATQASGPAAVWEDFVRLCSESRLALVSIIDFAVLSLAVVEPMREDMLRRTNGENQVNLFSAWKYAAVPVFGPLFYLLTRPPLPNQEE